MNGLPPTPVGLARHRLDNFDRRTRDCLQMRPGTKVVTLLMPSTVASWRHMSLTKKTLSLLSVRRAGLMLAVCVQSYSIVIGVEQTLYSR